MAINKSPPLFSSYYIEIKGVIKTRLRFFDLQNKIVHKSIFNRKGRKEGAKNAEILTWGQNIPLSLLETEYFKYFHLYIYLLKNT